MARSKATPRRAQGAGRQAHARCAPSAPRSRAAITPAARWKSIAPPAAAGLTIPVIPPELHKKSLGIGPLESPLVELLKDDDEASSAEGFVDVACRRFIESESRIGFTLTENVEQYNTGEGDPPQEGFGVAIFADLGIVDIDRRLNRMLAQDVDMASGFLRWLQGLDDVLTPAGYLDFIEQHCWRGESNEYDLMREFDENNHVARFAEEIGFDSDHGPTNTEQWRRLYAQLEALPEGVGPGYHGTRWIDVVERWPDPVLHPREHPDLFAVMRKHGHGKIVKVMEDMPSFPDDDSFRWSYDRSDPFALYIGYGFSGSEISHALDEYSNYAMQGGSAEANGSVVSKSLTESSAFCRKIHDYYASLKVLADAIKD